MMETSIKNEYDKKKKIIKEKVEKEMMMGQAADHERVVVHDDLALAGRGPEKKLAVDGEETVATRCCQAEKCTVNLSTEAKQYHKRHKVCEFHAKAHFALVAGLRQRFCQQCSRFHELSEFDDTKRSCRRRLAGHNERRRKSSSSTDSHAAEGSSRKSTTNTNLKELVCGQVDERGRIQISIQEKTTYNKHFQIR